jgi:hypothetical protein
MSLRVQILPCYYDSICAKTGETESAVLSRHKDSRRIRVLKSSLARVDVQGTLRKSVSGRQAGDDIGGNGVCEPNLTSPDQILRTLTWRGGGW